MNHLFLSCFIGGTALIALRKEAELLVRAAWRDGRIASCYVRFDACCDDSTGLASLQRPPVRKFG